MANTLSPTAANIISSLGIRGATVSERAPGYVPILDENGKISADLIPADAAQLAIPPVSDVAYVDPYTSVAEGARRGSVVAPFKSVTEAAANFSPTSGATSARTVAFVLAPGKYEDQSIVFPSARWNVLHPICVYLLGLGECRFTQSAVSITGMGLSESGLAQAVILQNVVAEGTIAIDGVPSVTCIGKTYVGTLAFASADAHVAIAPESRVSSTNAQNVSLDPDRISFLAADERIGNTSTVVGRTVKDALARLGNRKIRVAKITNGDSGFTVGSSCEDVPADSFGGYDAWDISARDRVLAAGINAMFRAGKFGSVTAGTVTATNVVAEKVTTRDLRMDALSLGGYRLAIDTYGYLVVSDTSDTPTPPPDSIVMLRDRETGTDYVLIVSNGRLYLREADEGQDTSDSSSDPYASGFTVHDPDSGYDYELYVVNGRLMIERT